MATRLGARDAQGEIEGLMKRMRDIRIARRLARIRARNEHFAQLDRIQSRLTPTFRPVDPLEGPDRDQNDLLAMQNMFWHVDHPARASRGNSIQIAVNSIAQHNLIAADKDTLCMYCDGAKFLWGAGAAVVIPRLRYSLLKRVTRAGFFLGFDAMYQDNVSSAATELCGLVLALEAAVKFAAPGQRVAVFCDAQGTVDLNRKIWSDSNGLGGEPLRRATVAVDELNKRNIDMRMYWLAKNLIVPGSQLAHTCARKAAHREPGEEVEVSERTWQQDMAAEAAEEVRQAL